jgi:hypothetical protein
MLVLTSSRPEYRAPWAGRDKAATLALEPVSGPDTTRVASL